MRLRTSLILAVLLVSAAARADDAVTLTGDWNGARGRMEDAGYRFGLNLTAEVFGNATGGDNRGAVYEDLIEAVFDADLQKAMGWDGALAHVNAYLTHGRGLSAHYLGNNLLTVSNIEADRGGRLFDLWLQQTFLKGAVSLRVGQVAAAEEFFVSPTAALFLNGTYGWPAAMSANLPGGGPTYPLATPGARLAYAVTEKLSLMAGVFNGNPSGPGPGGPLARNPSGTNFRLDDGAFVIAEMTFRPNDKAAYKFGAWYHDATFTDLAADAQGRSLALPDAGAPRAHHSDHGVYALADMGLWAADGRSLSGFLRVAAAPGDRNLIGGYIDAGLTVRGVFGAEDTAGLAFAYAGIGSAARRFDRDVALDNDPTYPLRAYEDNIELTYQAGITRWLVLQPDVQVVIHPGAARQAAGALAVGLRSVVVF